MNSTHSMVIILCAMVCVTALAIADIRYRMLSKRDDVSRPPGPQGPMGAMGEPAPRIISISHEDGVWTFTFSDGSDLLVQDYENPPRMDDDVEHPYQPEGERWAASPMEAQLLRYTPKPGREGEISCHCHGRALQAGQQVLWWPNEDGTTVIYCDQSKEYVQFVKAARDLAASQ